MLYSLLYDVLFNTVTRKSNDADLYVAGTTNAGQAQSVKIQNNVIKTVILVSGLYAIAWLPYNVYYLLATVKLVSFYADAYYAMTFIAFLYTTTNPFIYGTKFNPVKQILAKMIPCKKSSVQPIDHSAG